MNFATSTLSLNLILQSFRFTEKIETFLLNMAVMKYFFFL